jgi:arylsulfatase A-like enzyme
MKPSANIKLAASIGLVVGILAGTIDIIARIIALNFEWFEFYQTLLTSSVVFTLGFVIVGIIVEIARKIIGIKVTEKGLSIFYTANAMSLLLLFYAEVITIKILLFPHNSFLNPKSYKIVLLILLAVMLVYAFLLTKGRQLISAIVSFTQKKRVQRFISNYVFIIVVFVIVSLLMDVYYLNSMPSSVYDTRLEGYPNILLIVLDTVRADHLSLYNYPHNTSPNIDKFAKDAVVFDNAISPSSWTLPSHSSMFTGKYLSKHNATSRHQKLDEKETTLAEILRAKGYNTAGFIGGVYCKGKYGVGQGFATYKDRLDFFEYKFTFDKFSIMVFLKGLFPVLNKALLDADGERSAEEVNRDVFKWLEENGDAPFFMFINYFDAHLPHNPRVEFRRRFTNETLDSREVGRVINMDRYANVSEHLIGYIASLYDSEISYLDYHLGKLFKKLDELGIKDNTVIIITADHGEEFYDHGDFDHGKTLYEEVTHVPLLIYYPKEFKPKRIERRVGTMNIFSTVLDILDIDIDYDVDSVSLVPLIKNESGYEMDFVGSELIGRKYLDEPVQKAISYKQWKLIEVSPEKETLHSSLFNLRNDPKEQKNLYNRYNKTRDMLRRRIAEILGPIQD